MTAEEAQTKISELRHKALERRVAAQYTETARAREACLAEAERFDQEANDLYDAYVEPKNAD